MTKLKSYNVVPPGGWRYLQPDTQVWFKAYSKEQLVDKVLAHRRYKGLPEGDVSADIDTQICLTLGPEWCRPEPGETHVPVKDLTADLTTELAKSFTKAIIGFIASGGKLVDKPEAERRAAICRSCPLNRLASSCPCAAVYKGVELLVPSGRNEPGVSVCMACGCSLKAKVNLPMDVIESSLPADINLPTWCWQRPAAP